MFEFLSKVKKKKKKISRMQIKVIGGWILKISRMDINGEG